MKFNTPDNRDPRWGPEVDAAIALKVAQAVSFSPRLVISRDGVNPISIPQGMAFADLRLSRDPDTGDVSFDTTVIERIERESGLPEGFFMGQPEDALAALITTWYSQHLAAGGERDAVADDLIAEARAEDAAGQPYSHAPGQA